MACIDVFGTRHSTPRFAIFCKMAGDTTCAGYSYTGISLTSFMLSAAAVMAFESVPATHSPMPPQSRLVMNDVGTLAPLS